MTTFKRFLGGWGGQLIGVLAICLLVWLIGPLLVIGESAPLESVSARVIASVVILALWFALYGGIRLLARRKDRELVKDLAASDSEQNREKLTIDENNATLARRFEEALSVLKQSRTRRGDPQFLYKLPWYIIIGPPGSGKTTALVNSGLKFPLAGRMEGNAVRGVSGTRNCDWFFTDEAILIDTAGRYATQDSHLAIDAAEWRGFLDLLKKYRPRQPVNGVLVTLSLADLLRGAEERMAHAQAIRQRIQELHTVLGIRFPVYMLFTKCDLVAGFTDCFADLSEEERAQVWGETSTQRGPDTTQDFVERIGIAYEALLKRLNRRCSRRIQDERDLSRRSLILNFPEQMGQYRRVLEEFVAAVFGANRYEVTPFLRGIYFTSGTQEGTPIDRIMGILSAAYGFDRQSVPIYSGRGKSYFISRLLREVIFREADLAGLDPRLERRQRLLQWGALAGAASLAGVSLLLWAVSYSTNLGLIQQTAQAAAQYRALEPPIGTDWPAQWQAAVARLDTLLEARDASSGAGILARFGLYQGDKLMQAAEHAYSTELQNNFLPLLMQRTAQRMTSQQGAPSEALYELLRVYLMLSQPERMQPAVAKTWLGMDWEQSLRSQPELLPRLSVHLDHLLKLDRPPAAVDEPLVANVRARLSAVPLVTQLYLRFKDELPDTKALDIHLGAVLGPEAGQVFALADGRELSSVTLPGLFTARGYTDLFLTKSLVFFKQAINDNWVLGQTVPRGPAELMRMYDDYRQLYLDDYRRAWADVLANLQLRQAQGLNPAIILLEALSRPDNPLVKLLETVEKNTSLTRLALIQTDIKPDERTQRALEAARGQTAGADPQAGPEQRVEAAFASLNSLVRKTGDAPPAIGDLLQTLEKLHDYLMRVASFAGGGEQALKQAAERMAASGPDVIAEAKAAFARLPEPLKTWLTPLATLGWKQVLSGARGELAAQLRTDVAAACKAALPGRYPFAANGQRDMPLIEFGKLFGPKGAFDQFFETRFKGFVDTRSADWKPVSVDQQSIGLSSATIKQFQVACRIREAFFAAGGPLPKVAFELKPIALDERAASFSLSFEGQEIAFQRGAEAAMTLQWPGQASGAGVKAVFHTADGQELVNAKEGPWAFFRLLDDSRLETTAQPERFNLTFQQGGYTARYELRASSPVNPFNLAGLRGFNCPETL